MVGATTRTKSSEKWGARRVSRRGASELLLISPGLACRRPRRDPGRATQSTGAAAADPPSRTQSCPVPAKDTRLAARGPLEQDAP